MSNPQHHQSARRALRLQWILQGHAFDGLRLKQIAEALQVASPMALRDLQLLADEGIAERIPGNEECWRLTPKLIQLAAAEKALRLMATEIERTRRRVNALEHVLIPSFIETIRGISMKLDEMERANLGRLMRIKEIVRSH